MTHNTNEHDIFSTFQVPGGGPPGAPGQPGGGPPPPPFKLNIVESIERIKEEFNFLQAQYHKYVNLPILIIDLKFLSKLRNSRENLRTNGYIE